jgi:phosphatidylserine/phosphatidylglycerophosphate/cardiolipin synthase-like enzyme
VDGSAYYPAFAEAVERARHSVLIAGWDIHSKIPLRKDGVPRDLPDTLAAFLDAVARRTPGLHIHILSWDFAMLYALERETLPLLQLGWRTHRRVHFRLDGRHPLGACRHQKIVVVDDRVAFLGGFDLAGSRWDTPEHLAGDPATGARGRESLWDLSRRAGRRGGRGGGGAGRLDPRPLARGGAQAPDASARPRRSLASQRRDCRPRRRGLPSSHRARLQGTSEIREIEAVLLEAIANARRHVFLETQYFTSSVIGEALGAALERPHGPEVVAVVPAVCSGWLEEATMGNLRARLLRHLQARDRHRRFRCWYPAAPGLPHGVNVHSKVVEVDGPSSPWGRRTSATAPWGSTPR